MESHGEGVVMDKPSVHPVCERLEPGTPVGVRLRCRRFNCRFDWDGSAEVVNAYGVRDVIPNECPNCGLRSYDVTEVVEVGS